MHDNLTKKKTEKGHSFPNLFDDCRRKCCGGGVNKINPERER